MVENLLSKGVEWTELSATIPPLPWFELILEKNIKKSASNQIAISLPKIRLELILL